MIHEFFLNEQRMRYIGNRHPSIRKESGDVRKSGYINIMKHFERYITPKEYDDLLLGVEDTMVTSITFIEEEDSLPKIEEPQEDTYSVRKWLDDYFGRKCPRYMPRNIKPTGVSIFNEEIISLVKEIPYGETLTYGDLARIIAKRRGIKRMSSQAIGGAVGRNPIVIIIPCHRVLGNGHKLVGYHGGIKNKEALLKLEGIHYEK